MCNLKSRRWFTLGSNSCIFTSTVHSFCSKISLKGLKVTNEQQDDRTGVLHQVAQHPIDQVYL